MVKYQFGKNWSWCNEIVSAVEIDEKQIDIVYRMDANPCSPGACKTNCASNPYCLNGLGEKRLASLLQKESTFSIERSDYFRESNEYAGLINLGATCYINTYLQVWYNNLIFREYVLRMAFEKMELDKGEDGEDEEGSEADKYEENVSETMPALKIRKKDCLGTNLQLIFTLMKESVRKSIDPNFFIKALGLDENMQQDAQEFSQLFLTTLQNTFMSMKSRENNDYNIINELFQGDCAYITECETCKRQSTRTSNFFELSLNIQNCSTIRECINDLLKEESMDGDNQYHCSNCQSKQNAKRMTKLDTLPPVLNLQLLRFVYDRNSGLKKKLSNRIKFGDSLDLNEFTKEATHSSVYQLGAILMHVGKSAYSGHYMAQIKNFQTNEWFNFNDESITKVKKKQQLGCTDEEFEAKNEEKNEAPNQTGGKIFSTANAYLLVYYRNDLLTKTNDEQQKESNANSTTNQSDLVKVDNSLLETWFSKFRANKLDQNESKNTERAVVNTVYSSLWLNNQTDALSTKHAATNNKTKKPANEIVAKVPRTQMYFLSVEFLKKLLSFQNNLCSSDAASINSIHKYLCQHRRLNPLAINKFKLVNKEGLDKMMGAFALKLSDLGALEAGSEETTRCKMCVLNCFEYLKCKERLKTDVKLLRNLLKMDVVVEDEINNCNKHLRDEDLTSEQSSSSCEQTEMANLKRMKNGSDDDVIVIEKDDDSKSVMSIEEQNFVSNESKEFFKQQQQNCEEKSQVKQQQQQQQQQQQPTSTSPKNSAQMRVVENNKENNEFTTGNVYFWLGKESIKVWQTLAIKRFESQLPHMKFSESNEATSKDGEEQDENSNSTDIQEICVKQSDAAKTESEKPTSSTQIEPNYAETLNNLTYFNEDIVCPHGNLSPTPNKKLISAQLWYQYFEPYFYSVKKSDENGMKQAPVFTNDAQPCKICLRTNEEISNRKNEIKNQKEILAELYFNRQRPNLLDAPANIVYYLIGTDFAKEWRSLIKLNKFKDLKIVNASLLCPHGQLPFNHLTIDPSMVTILTEVEWNVLSASYEYDKIMTFIKIDEDATKSPVHIQNSDTIEEEKKNDNYENERQNPEKKKIGKEASLSFIFEPSVCEQCVQQNELNKLAFEDKKIFIRQIDDEVVSPAPNSAPVINERKLSHHDDCEIIHVNPKKARLLSNADENLNSAESSTMSASKKQPISKLCMPQSSQNNFSSNQTNANNVLGMRRSKRSRRCKGDLGLLVSSHFTIKQIKSKIATNLTRLISEQHLFHRNLELENEKTLADYQINEGEIIYLKLDQTSEEIEGTNYELAHLPEIGFKGTNLMR